MTEIRDNKGNLVAYDSEKPGCVFGEILSVKIDKRMERIESNLGDARIDIQKLSADLEHAREQVSGLCGLIYQLQNEVRVYAAVQTEANHENRLRTLEGHAKFIQGAAKICFALVGLSATIWGIIKYVGGKP